MNPRVHGSQGDCPAFQKLFIENENFWHDYFNLAELDFISLLVLG
jgi:hypothetical protein